MDKNSLFPIKCCIKKPLKSTKASKILASVMFGLSLSCAFAISDAPPFTRTSPVGNPNTIYSYNDAIKNATKAVVNITTEKKISGEQSPFNDPFFQQFFGDVMPNDNLRGGIGSGVILTSDGYIVTNSHVINGADKIIVSIPGDSKKYTAKLIGEDTQSDIAVIRIDKRNLPTLQFADSTKYDVGDVVFAIGNPFGVGESVTQGIISALNKHGFGISSYENFIQTDASINPGNSGGALIDSRGALIGMNTAIISRTGGNHGIGFAIPSQMVKNVAAELIRSGKIRRGFIGVSIKDVDQISSAYKDSNGALVIGIQANSPAQKAGLAVWDLIVAVDGKPIKNAAELRNTIGAMPPNKQVTLTVLRNNTNSNQSTLETKQIQIRLAEQPQESSKVTQEAPTQDKGSALSGMRVENLTNQARRAWRVPNDINGVLITDVDSNSKAESLGFKKGDIIAQIEDMPIKSITDFQRAIQNYKNKSKRILIYNMTSKEVKTIIMD